MNSHYKKKLVLVILSKVLLIAYTKRQHFVFCDCILLLLSLNLFFYCCYIELVTHLDMYVLSLKYFTFSAIRSQ